MGHHGRDLRARHRLGGLRDAHPALEVFASVQHLRLSDGSYWTGWQFDNQAPFPRERSSWTAAAVVLAADALAGFSGGAGIFTDAGRESADPVAGPLYSRSEPSLPTSVNAPDFSARW